MDEQTTPEKKISENFKAYEDGKHRRYTLLFSVNGGAFAIAKIIHDESKQVLGHLTLQQLSIGMMLFSLIMVFDIFMFGQKMRRTYVKDVFALPGKLVLIAIGILICAGWLLVIGQ